MAIFGKNMANFGNFWQHMATYHPLIVPKLKIYGAICISDAVLIKSQEKIIIVSSRIMSERLLRANTDKHSAH